MLLLDVVVPQEYGMVSPEVAGFLPCSPYLFFACDPINKINTQGVDTFKRHFGGEAEPHRPALVASPREVACRLESPQFP